MTTTKIQYADRKNAIRKAIISRAQKREKITYGELNPVQFGNHSPAPVIRGTASQSPSLARGGQDHGFQTGRGLGKEVGIPAIGPWKGVLDEIGREETGAGRPDLTYLVVNSQTKLPGQIGFKPAKPASEEQKRMAQIEFEKVWDLYAPKAL